MQNCPCTCCPGPGGCKKLRAARTNFLAAKVVVEAALTDDRSRFKAYPFLTQQEWKAAGRPAQCIIRTKSTPARRWKWTSLQIREHRDERPLNVHYVSQDTTGSCHHKIGDRILDARDRKESTRDGVAQDILVMIGKGFTPPMIAERKGDGGRDLWVFTAAEFGNFCRTSLPLRRPPPQARKDVMEIDL